MVVELSELLRESSSHPPHDPGDMAAVVQAGRRRVRLRRVKVLGGTALATAAVATTLAVSGVLPADRTAGRPEGPVLRLSDATRAVEGEDYRVLASHDLDDVLRGGAEPSVAGVTDDGMVLLHGGLTRQRFTLLDPATGEKDRLPEPEREDGQSWMLADLGGDSLVLLTSDVQPASDGSSLDTRALIFDRRTRTWTATSWEDLPPVYEPQHLHAVHDGRLYVSVLVEGREAGETALQLWSASLTDGTDVRDEGVEVGAPGEEQVGAIAFTEDEMVWTNPSLGTRQEVHVRDLGTGEESSFAVPSTEGCEPLPLSAVGDRIVLSQRCGAHDGSAASDDRVQVLTTEGDLVTTIRDDAIVGVVTGGPEGPGQVTVTSFGEGGAGTYVYDLGTERFLRISDTVSPHPVGGSETGPRQFMWQTPVEGGDGNGATQWVGELID